MGTRRMVLLIVILVAAVFIGTAVVYPSVPQRIPIHWNIHGKVDGWGDKALGIWLMPGILVVTALAAVLIPYLAPRGFETPSAREAYGFMMVATCGLIAYDHCIIVREVLQPGRDLGRALFSGLFLYVAAISNLLGKIRPNPFVGVRTPWTYASESVWIATHRIAARLMFAAAIIAAAAEWLGAPILLCGGLLLVAALAPAAYSYVLFKRLKGGE